MVAVVDDELTELVSFRSDIFFSFDAMFDTDCVLDDHSRNGIVLDQIYTRYPIVLAICA